MPAPRLTRREFLRGCSAAIAGLAGSRLAHLSFASPENAGASDEILLVVFLRGGWDALNVVPPIAGPDRGHYETARPNLKVPVAGPEAALALDGQFGLHPALAPLYDVYQDGKLAVVHAAGLTSDTRSHFDAMQFMEMGTPGVKSTTTGWLTRHLNSAEGLPDTILLPALSAGASQTASLQGSHETVAMTNPDTFSFIGHWLYRDQQRSALRRMYNGNTWLYEAGTQTLDAIDLIETVDLDNYTPANGAVYPDGSFGDNLEMIAQIIKLDVGLRVATVDLGGWDTHEYQGDGSSGYMASLLGQLGQGLAAFHLDLDGTGSSNYTDRLTAVVKSEFGRRLRENASRGTDHGHGCVLLVMGGHTNGGQVYGQWPGLSNEQLYDGADLEVTTDYRRVLSEILIRRLGNPQLGIVFPGYSDYQPMGIVQGADLEPVYGQAVHLPALFR